MADDRRALGAAGERIAADHLEAKGYRVERRNVRRREGEIDLVARAPDGTRVFVEVRTRRGADAGGVAAASVDPRKQRRLRELAATYLAEADATDADARIDVVTVAFDGRGQLVAVEHIENAVVE